MKKIPLRVLSDGAFVFFASFCITLVFVSFFAKPPYSVIIAVSVGVAVSAVAVKKISARIFLFSAKKQDEKKMNETFGELGIATKQKTLSLFSRAFSKKGVFVKRRSGGLFSPKEKTLYLFHFGFVLLNKNDVVTAINKLQNGEKAVIFTHELKDPVKDFAVRFNGKIEIKQGKETYDFLNSVDCLPKPTFTPVGSGNFKTAVYKSFSKKRAPKFFALGLLFLFCSFLVPMRIYYAVFGSVLVILSLVCVLLPNREKN